ncbi:MAG: histidine phosphatase family protein [Anaerolineae bacterium]
MSHLVLVRHGQASMFADDYDHLSPVGEAQSRCLGHYWLRHGVTFDAVYVGPRRRQQGTEAVVRHVYTDAGQPWPTAIVLDGLDEYDGDGVLREFLPVLAERDAEIRRLAAAWEQHRDGPERYRHFQRLFQAVVAYWVAGEVESPVVESWQTFHGRVARTLRHIMASEGSGRRVAVFTSGGVISIAAQLAMRAPASLAIELNWRIRNGSLTEMVFSRDKVTLDTLNTIPHLAGAALWTYR